MSLITDFEALLVQQRPLMDVRAPIEFARGAIPHAINLPLLNDEQRRQVGLTYRHKGNQAAVSLGHHLVGGAIKAVRLSQWVDFSQRHPTGCLYCFRGGQRSAIVQQWLAQEGVDYPRIAGGYKAMRQYLLSHLTACDQLDLILVAGRTGVGKTELLQRLPAAINLEALAKHRGSAFGRLLSPQPSQVDFENTLAVTLLQQQAHGFHTLAFEDESKHIGRCALPRALWESFAQAPMVVVEDRLEDRVTRICQEYVQDIHRAYSATDPAQAMDHLAAFLHASLARIARRLGGLRYQQISRLMNVALAAQAADQDFDAHRSWIAQLLQDYYDPMYDYQLEGKQERILRQGKAEDLHQWLSQFLDTKRAPIRRPSC